MPVPRPIVSGFPVGSAASATGVGDEDSFFELHEEEILALIQPVGIEMGRDLTCGLGVGWHRCAHHRDHTPDFS